MTDRGAARTTDPSTSHDAAASVNATKLEARVLHTLQMQGPMTAEQVANYLKMTIPTISPRFAPLCEKRMIEKIPTEDGWLKRRSHTSNRQRLVYRYQPDFTEWCSRPKRGRLRQRIETLEAGLREIRDIARVSEGVEFYAMLAEKYLEEEDV
jgi:DNA-binding MarR family transcriptional regulator